MPLNPKSSVSENIRELHTGRTYSKTTAKFGKADADRQAVAIALSTRRGRANGGVVPGYDIGGPVNPQIAAAMADMAQHPGAGPGMTPPGMPPNQFNSGLNPPAGVAPSPPMSMNTPGAIPPPMGMPAPTGVAQAPSPAGMTTPNNPMARPLMARGGVPERASGGFNMAKGPNLNPSWETKQEARGMMHVGPIPSIVPGRTDNHHAFVPSGSYVLPASHVSSMGQGNSIAGLSAAHSLFGSGGPYGAGAMKISHGSGAPRPPSPMKFADGGSYSEGGARGEGDHVPVECMLAGGEFVIEPSIVRSIGKGSLKNGHKILDAYVMAARKKEIETQKRLPPPAKR